MKGIFKITFLFFLFLGNTLVSIAQTHIVYGATQLESYNKILQQENVGVVAHQASLLDPKTHLIDTLLSLNVNIIKVFAPEHGFRGDADAGRMWTIKKTSKQDYPFFPSMEVIKNPLKKV